MNDTITLLYKCHDCSRVFEVQRSVVVDKDELLKNLCKIKDVEIKDHFDRYHKKDICITIFPNLKDMDDLRHVVDINEKIQVDLLCGLVLCKRADGSLGFAY